MTRQGGENEDIKIYKYKAKKKLKKNQTLGWQTVLAAFTCLWQGGTATGRVTDGERTASLSKKGKSSNGREI